MEGFAICDPCVHDVARVREQEAGLARSIRIDLAKTISKTTGLPRDTYKTSIRERRDRKELGRFLEEDERDGVIE